MNSPHNPWIRLFVGVFLGAIALQLIIEIIRPLVPYMLAVILIIVIVAAVRWWRDRW